MLCLYERDRTSLWLELCYDSATAEYVGLLHHPDGRQASQRFSALVAFRQWFLAVEMTLTADRWALKRSPDILPEGWPENLPLM